MRLFLFLLMVISFSCSPSTPKEAAASEYPVVGTIERLDSAINALIPPDAKIEQIASGLTWAEGPLWVEEQQMLLCSDVKQDRIYRWTEKDGLSVFVEPSGFTGTTTDSREKGSNGLVLNPEGELVLCQHGNRQIAKMQAGLSNPQPIFETLVDKYAGKRFNSPNDLIYDSKGNLYFTDPPFGLSEALEKDPKKELDFQGVYKYDTTGNLRLMTKAVSRPNGLALSPDEQTLYVANTDAQQAVWYAFELKEDTLVNEAIIYDATALIDKEVGYPDGVKVDANGNIYTAGPGGIWIFSPDFKLLGKIKPGLWASNCNFNADYSVLYITADDYLLRLKLN